MCKASALLLVILLPVAAQNGRLGIGHPATADQIKAADNTVFPDGRGLPPGKGTAERGEAIYKDKCAVCHNDKGEGREGQYPALAGGIGSLKSDKPVRTVGSYWPYATTLWDVVHRSMPYDHPRTLSVDDVYSVTAYVLYLNGLVKQSDELNEKSLPAIAMPNRKGFVPDPRPVAKEKK